MAVIRLAGLLFGLQIAIAAAQVPVVEIADNDWQPWFFAGDPKAPPGLAKEILTECVAAAGYQASFRNYPIPRMWEYIRAGQIDLNVLSRKPEREEFLLYTGESILQESYQPFVRSDSDIRIAGIKDFDGLRLGHLNGLRYSPEFLAYVQAREAAGTLDITTQNISNIRKLAAGQIDIFVNTKASMLWLARDAGLGGRIKALDLVIAGGDYYVALSKASPRIADKPGFLGKLDSCLKDVKASGRYADLQRKYGIE